MLRKYALTEILGAEIAPEGQRALRRFAHRHSFEYTPRPGYLYVRSRAISSRTNDNFDTFPAEEIKTAYMSFVGKPVFVNHNNDNHRRARGVIIDAALHEDKNPDGTPDTWAEVLMEVDAVRFPKLAKAILAGEIDRTSMGTDVKFSKCSFCGNKATTPLEYCQHIPKLKGKRIERRTASGTKESVLVSEVCYGLGFFENSLLVEEPADPTAFFLGVDDHSSAKTASKEAEPVRVEAKRLPTTKPVSRPIRPKTATEVYGHSIELGPGEHESFQQAHEAAGLQAEAKGPAHPNPADHPSYQWLGLHPDHVIDHWNQASDDEKHQGMRWYEDAHHVAKTISGGDAHKGAGVLSAYSPQTNWPANMFNAARSFKEKRAVKKGEGINVMSMHHNAAHAIMSGVHHQEALNGPKTQDFAHLIEHGGKDPETGKHSNRVVVDRHAMSVLAGRRLSGTEAEDHISKALGSRHYYEHAADMYRHAAEHISKHTGQHVAPHQVQAVTWLVRQRLNNDHINDAGGRPASMLKGRQKAERNARDQFNDHMREHHEDHVHDSAPYNMHYNAALVYQAYGETMAPADVDTLRDEACPVCGENDAYDGNECMVCGFVAPPKMFQDPDLDMAKQMDLRKDNLDAEQADPNGDGMPDVIPGSGAPGPSQMPMDPSQVPDPQDVAQQQINQIREQQQPLDPVALDINGQPINQADMAMQEPQEPNPNALPLDPQDVAGQPEPGTPGDDEADLACPNCGYQAPASPPQSTDMGQTAPEAGFAAGAICPNCQQAPLMSLKQMNADADAMGMPPQPVKRF